MQALRALRRIGLVDIASVPEAENVASPRTSLVGLDLDGVLFDIRDSDMAIGKEFLGSAVGDVL
jgi:hypothetical protein